MKAIETTATIDAQGHLALDRPLNIAQNHRVRVIVLIPEEETDPDDDPTETIIEGIREGWQQALAGEAKPVSELWGVLDVE